MSSVAAVSSLPKRWQVLEAEAGDPQAQTKKIRLSPNLIF
jgi:hypothetical protein